MSEGKKVKTAARKILKTESGKIRALRLALYIKKLTAPRPK
jgi:hypothetical protein